MAPMNPTNANYSTTPQHTGGMGLRLIGGLGWLVGRWRQVSVVAMLRMSQAGDGERVSLREWRWESELERVLIRDELQIRVTEREARYENKRTNLYYFNPSRNKFFFFFLSSQLQCTTISITMHCSNEAKKYSFSSTTRWWFFVFWWS